MTQVLYDDIILILFIIVILRHKITYTKNHSVKKLLLA